MLRDPLSLAFVGIRGICRGTRAVDERRFGNCPSCEAEHGPVLKELCDMLLPLALLCFL